MKISRRALRALRFTMPVCLKCGWEIIIGPGGCACTQAARHKLKMEEAVKIGEELAKKLKAAQEADREKIEKQVVANRIWFIELLADDGTLQYHLSLGGDVPEYIRKQLEGLMKKGKISGFRMAPVDDLIVRAAEFYHRLGLDR